LPVIKSDIPCFAHEGFGVLTVFVSPVESKPATKGRIKTSQSKTKTGQKRVSSSHQQKTKTGQFLTFQHFEDLEAWRAAVDKGSRSRRTPRFMGNAKG
jgi:hypothetical protein